MGGGGPRGGQPKTELAVRDALAWLSDHQTVEGRWDADEFMLEDKYADKPASTGKGNPVTDVGLTGLSLLAFEAHRSGPGTGEYGDEVARGEVTAVCVAKTEDGQLRAAQIPPAVDAAVEAAPADMTL